MLLLIKEKHCKSLIFNIFDFPHIKNILQKCVKNDSFFPVLQREILHWEKVTFLKQEKNWIFVFKTFSGGSMALKTCGKDALENS